MITFIRTATMTPGKTQEAMTFAHQVALLCERITGIKVGVSVPIAGNPFRVAWTSATPDLGVVETAMDKLLSNKEYVELVESAAPYFLPGTVHDEMWRGV
jgi:hypothetical protein